MITLQIWLALLRNATYSWSETSLEQAPTCKSCIRCTRFQVMIVVSYYTEEEEEEVKMGIIIEFLSWATISVYLS